MNNTYVIKVLGTQYIVLKNGRWIAPSPTCQAFGTREAAEKFINSDTVSDITIRTANVAPAE